MNILKHMEAVFVASVAFAVSGSYLVDALPQAHASAPLSATANLPLEAPVVVVKAKRMSAEEKRQALWAERSTGASRN